MKIMIEYESSWRNSFLDGSNNEELPKKGRKFIASMTNLKKNENFIQREITLDTVMGILNRLIGDQRKLYQARQDDLYYFKAIEAVTSFMDTPSRINNNEMTYIRNMTGSTDQNSFTGMIKSNDLMFSSDYAAEFWGVLSLDFDDLCDFIIQNNKVESVIQLDPISVITRLELLNKEKAVLHENKVSEALLILNQHFPDANYLNAKGLVMPIMFYCSSLYLQLDRLDYDMDTAKTKSGGISGISKRGFTKKDFMNRFTSGDKKKIWGNPYIRKERIKGIGEVVSLLTKASGTLEVTIDISREKAKELENMIENAGVSSFYLGKKGLAYVSNISTREVR
ncbi:MAG: type I-Fv CRISPR-associated protein Cas5fv [Mariprofundaceae bacterium]|nr:type I-Fv CRISPR-associated protein Cas5fv [Mariprofundaceae bacterium]